MVRPPLPSLKSFHQPSRSPLVVIDKLPWLLQNLMKLLPRILGLPSKSVAIFSASLLRPSTILSIVGRSYRRVVGGLLANAGLLSDCLSLAVDRSGLIDALLGYSPI